MQDLERAFEKHSKEEAQKDANIDPLLLRRINNLALGVLLEWERASEVIRDGLEKICWWERRMGATFPLTFERLKQSIGRRANAVEMLQNNKSDLWRRLQLWLEESDREEPRIPWQLEQGAIAAAHFQDEFGVDRLHFVVRRDTIAVRAISLNSKRPVHRTYLKLSLRDNDAVTQMLDPVSVWTIPFQQASLVELRNPKTGGRELFWIDECHDSTSTMGLWNINRNNYADGNDFVLPHPQVWTEGGDVSSLDDGAGGILMAGTESRLDVPNIRVAATCITIRSRDMMFFDQAKVMSRIVSASNDDDTTLLLSWRSMLSLESPEPRLYGSVTASCYVLDAFLLYACSDGVLRAHPRSNPRSTYHVLDMKTRIVQVVGLYNVVAICHSYHILEIRHVMHRRNEDPFIHVSKVVFEERNVDTSHRPLLYGPFVIYRTLDGHWYRVRYDISLQAQRDSDGPAREMLKFPWKAGWEIRSIKSANWRFMTVTLVSNRGEQQDVLYFVPQGVPSSFDSCSWAPNALRT